MAKPPIQYFRKEDFPEIADKTWAIELFSKLNSLARQTQYGLSEQLSVQDNLLAFWWEGNVGYYKPVTTIFPTKASAISAFPFNIPSKLKDAKTNAVICVAGTDITDSTTVPVPAALGPVAWAIQGDQIVISMIGGMSPGRCYNIRLLVLGA